jgi:hypothetical protein
MDKPEIPTLYTEEQIPDLAKSATRSAFQRSLAAGNSVLISENGEIRRVFPDGTYEVVKETAPFTKVEKGKILKIK